MKFTSREDLFVLRYNTYFKSKEDGLLYIMGNKNGEVEVNKNIRYPQPLFDLAKAMLIVKEKAIEYIIDLDNISVCGFSAGANLAALLGVHWNSDLLKQKFKVENKIFKPKTIIYHMNCIVLKMALMECLYVMKLQQVVKIKLMKIILFGLI